MVETKRHNSMMWRVALVAAGGALIVGACGADEPGVAARDAEPVAPATDVAPPGTSTASDVERGAHDRPEPADSPAATTAVADDPPAGDTVVADSVASAPAGDTVATDPVASPPGDESLDDVGQSAAAPSVHAAAAAGQTIIVSEAQVAGLAPMLRAVADEPSDADVIAEWIAGLTALEQALDADAIRALGDDPVLEAIAGPVEELDRSVAEVIALLDPPTGAPDLLGALAGTQDAVERWEAAVPGMEAAWADAVDRWSAEWDRAVADWEAAWAEAVAEWEAAWAEAVAEWEVAWAEAVAEWEAAWAEAVAEWEAEWAEAVAQWEAEWADAAEQWEQAWEDAVAEWERKAAERRSTGDAPG